MRSHSAGCDHRGPSPTASDGLITAEPGTMIGCGCGSVMLSAFRCASAAAATRAGRPCWPRRGASDVRNLLTEPWTAASLRPLFETKPLPHWFNAAAPPVKSGAIKFRELTEEAALAMNGRRPLADPPAADAGRRRPGSRLRPSGSRRLDRAAADHQPGDGHLPRGNRGRRMRRQRWLGRRARLGGSAVEENRAARPGPRGGWGWGSLAAQTRNGGVYSFRRLSRPEGSTVR